MASLALSVTTRTKPGQRNAVYELWKTHLRDRAAANEAQDSYFFCIDRNDPDVFVLFEVYTDPAVLAANAGADWFADYMARVAPHLDGEPQVRQMTPIWVKGRPNLTEDATDA